jgi:hypothetical protein
MFNRRLAQHVKLGRRITGKEKPNDVLSPRAQVQHGFMVQTLPQYETDSGENEALYTLCKTISTRRPPDQAAFRIDIPAWVRSHTERTRNVICALIVGERTKDLANRHGQVIVVVAESGRARSPPSEVSTMRSTGLRKRPHRIGRN